MPPSQLQIATSALQRLVKEKASYHKELESQTKRIAEAEKTDPSTDQNIEFKIKQEKKAREETKAVFPGLRERIANAREKLQAQLDAAPDAAPADIEKAKEALKTAIEAQKNDPDSQDMPPT